MLKTGLLIDKETRTKKLSELDIMLRIKTALNIATGDDGHQAKKVIDIFTDLCHMSKKEYEEQVKHFG